MINCQPNDNLEEFWVSLGAAGIESRPIWKLMNRQVYASSLAYVNGLQRHLQGWHVLVSLSYMVLPLVVSLGFIYLCPDKVLAHWLYLIGATVVLAAAYVVFMKKYYHLHEEYLASLKQ